MPKTLRILTEPALTSRICMVLAVVLALLSSCAKEVDVVLYCALDQVYAEPLIERFERESGLTVRAEFDIEANKTVGLVERIRAEGNRPRCDVFWNNEVAHTVRLAEEGLLARYESPNAADIPSQFKDSEGRWCGFAARARILIVNTERADPREIQGMWDLLDPRYAGKTGIARPLTGTTLTHAAALYDVLGPDQARDFFQKIQKGGVNLAASNGQTMRLVREGELAFAFTDTDDYRVALEAGAPVEAVYPDQQGIGTLLIPNTVCILAEAPHPEAARILCDFILSPGVEAELAASRSAQIPLRDSVPRPDHVRGPGQFRAMEVDFLALGRALPGRAAELKEMFLN